ncbi:MAG: tyrosine-type recombinase/integrase [Verrucomicrobia bacterium]|jgi:integrase|nr:tyrosine-type recombinase/integrase [Verrucomicrobiota bacterium]
MANLYQRPNSPFWWMRFQVKGKAYYESTGLQATQKNEGKARALLNHRVQEVKNPASIEGLTTRILERIHELPHEKQNTKRREVAKRILGDMTTRILITDAWVAWRDDPEAEKTADERTLGMYEGRCRSFTAWLGEEHPSVKYVHEVTRHMAKGYATYLKSHKDISGSNSGIHVSLSTFRTHINQLKAMFRAFEKAGSATENVFDRISTKKTDADSKRDLTQEEIEIVLSNAQGKGNLLPWLLIGLYTGLRMGDVVTLRWSEVDLKRQVIERLPLKRRNARDKEKATVRIPMHPEIDQVLTILHKAAPRESEYVFPEDAATYQRDRSTTSTTVQAHLIECGIDTHKKGTGWQIVRDDNGMPVRQASGKVKLVYTGARGKTIVGFHSLRHSFVSLCAARNVPEVAMMELVGHGSPSMTRHYSHAGEETKRKAVMSIPTMSYGKKALAPTGVKE